MNNKHIKNFSKILNSRFYSLASRFLIVLLLISMFFFGYPVIWKNPRIPPKIKKTLAAQATVDATVHTTVASHLGGSPTTVFISQTTGYAFYRDSTGSCAYSKTTDGGITWGSAVTIPTVGIDCIQIAVWYDRWTPGDTTGNLIHIAMIDTGDDDIWYAQLNTSNDSLSTPVNITSGLGYAGTLAARTNHVTITKGTDGALYTAVTDASDNMMVRCTANCTNAANWAVSEPASWTVGNDFTILVPMISGRVILLWWDISLTTNDIRYSVWNGTSWSAFGNIDTALDNGTYDASWGAAVDPSTGDVYLAYAAQANTLGTDDDIRVRRYNFSSGTWSALTDVVTNSVCAGSSNCGITGVKIARDNTTGILYVLYTAQSTAGTASTGNLYWKYSTDGGSTWSQEFGPVYSSNDDIYGGRLSLTPAQMIVATWQAAGPDDLFSRQIAPKTFNQSAYRFFDNTDSTDVGSPLAAQNTAVTLSSAGSAFRLRMLLHVNIADLFTNEGDFKLQFAQRGADNLCDTSFTGETYQDITASTVIAFNDNPTPADGSALTANANDPTHGADTIVNQTYEELNNFTNSVAAISSDQDGKWDFSLKDNNAPQSTTYCFRVVKADGTLLETYSVIPQITTAAAPTITCSFSATSTSFSNLSPSAVSVSSPDITVTVTSSAGFTISVKDQGNTTTPGLYNSASNYLIPSPNSVFSATATLVAGTDGYGIQATTTNPNISINPRYNVTGNTVGGFTTTTITLASSTVSVSSAPVTITHKAAVSALAPTGNYQDTITYSCTSP